jgi:hypothetical protein
MKALKRRPRVAVIDFEVNENGQLISKSKPFDLQQTERGNDWVFTESLSRTYRNVDDEMLREDLFNEARHDRKRPLNLSKNVQRNRGFELNKRKPTLEETFVDNAGPRPRLDAVRVNTAYKRKADKVQPVDTDKSDGTKPGGFQDWRERAEVRERTAGVGDTEYKFWEWIHPRLAKFPRGQRLTERRREELVIGPDLTTLEKEVLVEILYNREGALAWDWTELGRISHEVAPPQKIKTIPHKPWQAKSFPVPRALEAVVIEIVNDKITQALFEPCEGPYRNPYFLVKKKKPGEYRLVIAAQNINGVTIRDANLPPSSDDFAEEFSGMWMTSLLDWLSGYDQIELHEESRDLTAIQTPTGLVRCVTLPQGATNSVAQFVRITNQILKHHIPERARPFLDDIAVKGPKSDYFQEEVVPGLRRFALEHLQNLDRVLLDLERAGATIAGSKLQLCMMGIEVVGYVCDRDGRHPQQAKVAKILAWPIPINPTELKGFLGICVYYRVWILFFAQIAEPLYKLLKRNVVWVWLPAHDEAMGRLKRALTSAPALVSIIYKDGGTIILAVDASGTGWGAVLMQIDISSGKRRPVRYESGIWSRAESEYDALKREARGLLKALKKFRRWLFNVYFVVETDAMTLAAQLNRQSTDLPGAVVNNWLAWIRRFDFDVKHVSGKTNIVADALSRRPATDEDIEEAENEDDIDEWLETQLLVVRGSIRPVRWSDRTAAIPRIAPVTARQNRRRNPEMTFVLKAGEYTEESQRLAKYLQDSRRPQNMTNEDFRALQKSSQNYFVRGEHLFRKPTHNRPSRRVIDKNADKLSILKALHNDSAHHGRESTSQRIHDRYFWEGQYRDVEEFIKTCVECQKRDAQRRANAMTPTQVDKRWHKIIIDVTNMPKSRGCEYLVVARSSFSGWIEARGLRKNDSPSVAKFLYEEIVCRHGVFAVLQCDGGPENKDLVDQLARKYGIHKTVSSSYHPQTNGQVEVSHKSIKNALAKMCKKAGQLDSTWMNHLHAVLWADRTTVKTSTGMTPYEIEYLDRPILPIELDITTWSVMNWGEVTTTEDLIAVRARALERRTEDLEEAAAHLNRMRRLGKEAFDKRHNLLQKPFEIGELVLSHDTAGSFDMSREHKLAFRWFGPFRVAQADQERGIYVLTELDGAQLNGTYAADRLKRFYVRPADFLTDMGTESGSEATTPEFSEGEPVESRRQRQVLDEILFSDEEEVSDDALEVNQNKGSAGEPRRSERIARRNKGAGRISYEFWVEVPRLPDSQRAEYGNLVVQGQSEEDYRWIVDETP